MQLWSVSQVADSVPPHPGLPGGVGRHLGDHGGPHLGERDPVPVVAEPAGDDGVRPRVPRPGGFQHRGQGDRLGGGQRHAATDDDQLSVLGVSAGDDALRAGDRADHGADDRFLRGAVLDISTNRATRAGRRRGALRDQALDAGSARA